MADLIFNVAKGRLAQYGDLAGGANDALIMMPLEATGIETDAVLRDKTTFTDLVSGATNEQTTLANGASGRKTINASVTVTVDQTNDRVDVDIPDQTWVTSNGNAVGDLVVGYDGDTTAGTDANIVPVSLHDFAVTPDGSDVTAQIATGGIWRAS